MSPSLRAGGLSEPEAGAEPGPEGKEGSPACAKPRLPEPCAADRRFGEGKGEIFKKMN